MYDVNGVFQSQMKRRMSKPFLHLKTSFGMLFFVVFRSFTLSLPDIRDSSDISCGHQTARMCQDGLSESSLAQHALLFSIALDYMTF